MQAPLHQWLIICIFVSMTKIAIIGAGAAGCFAAANIRDAQVDVYEAASRPMAKLAITGGGRCNITNSFEHLRSIDEAYPRGARLMKRALKEFSPQDTLRWFTEAGVRGFVTEPDGCVFPASQDALEIVRTLSRAMSDAGVRLHCGKKAVSLSRAGEAWQLGFADSSSAMADAVLITVGGAPRGLPMLDGLDIPWVQCVPSLFTFTVNDPDLRALMGLVVPAQLAIPGTSFRSQGQLLITDWGLSGPAVLRLSSYAARYLHDNGYNAPLTINWTALPQVEVEAELRAFLSDNRQKLLSSSAPFQLPLRLWQYIIGLAGLRSDIRRGELGSKGFARLVAMLTASPSRIDGRNHFRDEFVTAGGIDLSSIDPSTLQSKNLPGLYFAGEILDVDAITGGFNLQAAWSTAWLAARAIQR